MALAYICVRCEACESLHAPRQIERIHERAYCRPCARRIRTETCSACGHLTLDVHTPWGCLYEISETEFCPCAPPALEPALLYVEPQL